ncbi:sugar ABC transporter permease, partial [Exiguobacterium aquaticum]|nr:sugar ABC transporter permease [Exiguobacterium aquaticum]
MTVALPRQRVRARLSDAASGLLYLSPSIALFGIFLVYPLFRTIYLSFFQTDTQGTPLSYVGGEHYAKLFTSASFWQSIQA